MSPVTDESQYISAKQVRHRNKNRYSNILPGMCKQANYDSSSKTFWKTIMTYSYLHHI